jgi:hypothetical protein
MPIRAAYGFAFGFIVGPAIGARGFEPVGATLHVVVFAVFATALLAAFVAMALLLWGPLLALRAARSER